MSLEKIAQAVITETEKVIEKGKEVVNNVVETKFDINIDDRLDIKKINKIFESEISGKIRDDIDIEDRYNPEEYYNGVKLESSFEDRFKKTKREGWDGDRANSMLKIPEAKKYGVEGIEFRNGIPDFSPVAKGTCEIPDMHGGKLRSKDGIDAETGERIKSNFTQYDEIMGDTLRKQGFKLVERVDKKGEVHTNWVDSKGIEYTRHELNDMKTMQLVPRDIHQNCPHFGGCGECNIRDAKGGKFDE